MLRYFFWRVYIRPPQKKKKCLTTTIHSNSEAVHIKRKTSCLLQFSSERRKIGKLIFSIMLVGGCIHLWSQTLIFQSFNLQPSQHFLALYCSKSYCRRVWKHLREKVWNNLKCLKRCAFQCIQTAINVWKWGFEEQTSQIKTLWFYDFTWFFFSSIKTE